MRRARDRRVRFDQLTREPAPVERHEGPLCAGSAVVKRTRDVLLAHACLASNQDWPRQARESIDISHDGQHRRRGQGGLRGLLTEGPSADDAKLGPANPNDRPGAQLLTPDTNSIDPGPVGAVQIANRRASHRRLDATMVAAHGSIGEHDRIVHCAAERQRLVSDVNGTGAHSHASDQRESTPLDRVGMDELGASELACHGLCLQPRHCVPAAKPKPCSDRHDASLAEPGFSGQIVDVHGASERLYEERSGGNPAGVHDDVAIRMRANLERCLFQGKSANRLARAAQAQGITKTHRVNIDRPSRWLRPGPSSLSSPRRVRSAS
jgi:hypothetical protein